MIETLRLENIAIVERCELEFGPGLNVLTGETGAGKSLILGALSLLLGGRAPASTLRDGAERGSVEAVFRTDGLSELEHALDDRGLLAEGDDPHELVVTRSLSRSGRTRTRVGGELVPISTLSELFSGRIEISSQHSSQALLRAETHGATLDAAGDLQPQRAAVDEGARALQDALRELSELRARAEDRERRSDFLAFQIQEIDAAELEPGELESLRADRGRLAHAERLRDDGASALWTLAGDPDRGAEGSVTEGLGRALSILESLEALDPSLAPLVERLRDNQAELRDGAADLERRLAGLEADPARLAQVEERLAAIEALQRKYGVGIDEIRARRAALAEELEGLEGADARIGVLEGECAQRASGLKTAAKRLTRGRKKAARELSARVQEALAELAMPDARFDVALDPARIPEGLSCGPSGAEMPHFLLSTNPGESPRPLRDVASGGELSRVFLALKGALRKVGAGMVLVFDEVDAGVGGGVAERVGRALAELAAQHQVLCITHLPQIAAFADVHFSVSKSTRGGRTIARVEVLEGSQRIEEIARMAGGESVGDATRRHAEDLLRAKPLR